MYVECVYIHNCAKRKLYNTTSNASNNTYLPKVSVLDVLSISNTVKMAGDYNPSITSPEARVRVIEMLDGFLAKSAK